MASSNRGSSAETKKGEGNQYQLGESSRFVEEEWFGQSEEGPVLLGSKCRYCGKVSFPQRKRLCLNCLREGRLEQVPLSRRGKLHTYAVAVLGPPGFESPYAVGWIELPEGIKLFSVLADHGAFGELLRIGMEMEMVVGKLRTIQGEAGEEEIIGYKFRPVARAGDKSS